MLEVMEKQGHVDDYEVMLKRKDGSDFWSRSSIRPIEFLGKAALIGSFVDISRRKKIEEELNESEERFRLISENLPIGVALTRVSDSKVIFANPAYHAMVGYGPGELNGKFSPDFYEDPAEREKIIGIMKGRGFLKDHRVRLKKRDGEPFWIEATVQTIEYKGEKVFMGMSMDITARIRAEEEKEKLLRELKENESNLKILTESILDVFTAIDRDMKFTFWNKAAEELTGLRADEVLGKKWLDVMGGKASENTYRHMRMCLETGQPIRYENMTDEDGEKHYYEVSLFPTEGGATIISRDVTRKKITETALMESELKFSAMFNNAPVGMSLSAVDGREIMNVNQAWLDMTGYAHKEEVIGKTFGELGLNFGSGQLELFADGSRQSGRARGLETTFCTKKGVQRSILVNVDTIELGGRKFMLSTNEDITERKMAEKILKRDKESTEKLVEDRTKELIAAQKELERANRLMDIGALAATVAHELRNPLAAIHLMTYNIKRKAKKPELAPYIASIDQKIKESEQIINNLLFYTRLKPPQREGFNLYDLIEETTGYFEEMGKNKVAITKDTGHIKTAAGNFARRTAAWSGSTCPSSPCSTNISSLKRIRRFRSAALGPAGNGRAARERYLLVYARGSRRPSAGPLRKRRAGLLCRRAVGGQRIRTARRISTASAPISRRRSRACPHSARSASRRSITAPSPIRPMVRRSWAPRRG